MLGLVVLLFNDFYLKQQFGNVWTGKLSDFTGLFIFPLFVASLFPARTFAIYVLTAILFVYWKSPFSQGLIDLWNSMNLVSTHRTVDLTDLFALFVLPPSFLYFRHVTKINFICWPFQRVTTLLISLFTIFAFTATTLVKDRSIGLDTHYLVKQRHNEVESALHNIQSIEAMKIKRYGDLFPGDPDRDRSENTYFVDFSLDETFCDSERPKFSFILDEKAKYTEIYGVYVHFECRLYENNADRGPLDAKYTDQLQDVFKHEVIEKLTTYE